MKHFKIFVVTILWALAISCEKPEYKTTDTGFDYFPLKSGTFYIYHVEEIHYVLSVPETIQYELMIQVGESFLNAEGYDTYVLNRSLRQNSGDEWQPAETWSVRQTSRQLILSEGNIPFVLLEFPVRENKQWNGNAYNNEMSPFTGVSEDFYVITAAGSPCSVGETGYQDCLSVVQEDDEDVILYLDRRIERYARKIGLIMKESSQLVYCNNEGRGCVGQRIVDEGVIYKQILKEYGEI